MYKAILSAAALAAVGTSLPAYLRGPNYREPIAPREDPLSRIMEVKDDGGVPIAKQIGDINESILKFHRDIGEQIKKANDEIAANGKVTKETGDKLNDTLKQIDPLFQRLDKLEAKLNRAHEGPAEVKSFGQQFIEAEPWTGDKGMKKQSKVRLEIKQIVNAGGRDQPLVPALRLPGIQQMPNRRLRIRELLAQGRTASNLVQYARELVFSNNAGPQAGASPTVQQEGALKNESDITFELKDAPVVTLAHFIVASRQVLDDAPMLQSYIDTRLLYGLALEEEDEILNGDGSAGQLDGLIHNSTAYSRAKAGDTAIDALRRAMTQAQLSEFDVEFFVLNPIDWEGVELTKDSQGRYIIANPQSILGAQLWGKPVIATNSMPSGKFLAANGTLAAQLWDREDAAVEVSREDSDNFRRNLVTILAEERVALSVYRPQALIYGDLPAAA